MLFHTANKVEECIFQCRISLSGCLPQLAGGALSDDLTPTQEDEAVAVGGVIHGVAGDDYCDPTLREVLKVLPEGNPQLGVNPYRGLIQE